MSVTPRNEKAILLLAIIVLLPMLFVDNAWRITAYFTVLCVIASGFIGAARITMSENSFGNLYRSTDKVFYEAKRLGGNRIVYAEAE